MTDRNPLTGLPGNRTIREVLQRDVLNGSQQAVYVDIINFKPFNDHYGFALGDAVIRRLGQILEESVGGFTGHIGGDDFICTGMGDGFRRDVEGARQRFRGIVPGFYSRRDREQGGIETFDRRGSYRFFPMLDVSLVFAEGGPWVGTVEDLAAFAGRRKKQMKGEQVPEPVHPVLNRALGSSLPTGDLKALIEACGVLREEDAVPVLEGILSGDYGWNLRKSAALALGHIGNERCGEILLEALTDPNPHVRTRSVEGLVLAMGKPSGPCLMKLVDDPSTWVRRAVLRGIGRAGWQEGSPVLERAAMWIPAGKRINAVEERRAALEGMGMLGDPARAPFLDSLCEDRDYFPAGAAFEALCALGTDAAAERIIHRGELPPVVNLFSVSESNLNGLEKLAAAALEKGDRQAGCGLRFFEGFPGEFQTESISVLKRCLGSSYGEFFRRVVLILDSRGIPADRSSVARVANRLDMGQRIGDEGLCVFLRWVSRRGGVAPGALLGSFIRSGRRPVAASAALASGELATRGLDEGENPVNNKLAARNRKVPNDR